jgi:hypothetical protein
MCDRLTRHYSRRQSKQFTRLRSSSPQGFRVLIKTTAELEDRLSEPSSADVAAASALAGDILILGAGGKMGPSLAKLARRAIARAGTRNRVIAVARFTDPEIKGALEQSGIETVTSDLLQPRALAELPKVDNVIFMAWRRGSLGPPVPSTSLGR